MTNYKERKPLHLDCIELAEIVEDTDIIPVNIESEPVRSRKIEFEPVYDPTPVWFLVVWYALKWTMPIVIVCCLYKISTIVSTMRFSEKPDMSHLVYCRFSVLSQHGDCVAFFLPYVSRQFLSQFSWVSQKALQKLRHHPTCSQCLALS